MCEGGPENFFSFLVLKRCAYIDNFGGFALLTSVHMQIVADPIIHSLVELHLRSLLHNHTKTVVIKVEEVSETLAVYSASIQVS